MGTMKPSRDFLPGCGRISRREFGRRVGCGAVGLTLARPRQEEQEPAGAAVAVARNPDRRAAIATALRLVDPPSFEGRDVLLKGSFNSPDPYPASTHPDALRAIVGWLREKECGRVTLVERSGMGRTRDVWSKLGMTEIARELGIELLALEDLPEGEWRQEALPGSHWKNGVEVPLFLKDACIVQTCNLKTHRFGGVFSASLKNSVGLLAKQSTILPDRWNYMEELHSSPDQQSMIAEINQLYRPVVVVMDAAEVFCSGGPEEGERAAPAAALAAADRVALDAAGVVLLRLNGAGATLREGRVFDQPQIKRAVELELGVKSAKEIRFATADPESASLAARLEAGLDDPVERSR